MSLPLRTRRLASAATSLTTPSSSSAAAAAALLPQRRTLFWTRNKAVEPPAAPRDPLREDYLKKKAASAGLVRGDLASSSIFEDESVAGPKAAACTDSTPVAARNPHIMAAALDPDPGCRMRWERKMVIREIHARGRVSKAEEIRKSERVLVSKSHNFMTSVKKLGPLARQIAGKTVEEAIVQMRFSKKKAAKDVREHLEHARNEAIVKRGMGLGKVKNEGRFAAVRIQTKDGKRVKVEDPTNMYVEQAWVGKGDFGVSPDHRARGQIYLMQNPTTHLQLVLKEEATRIRQHAERETKIKNRKTWVQLPNRKITAQRQYYSW